MQGINILSVYATADNRYISLHNIRYMYKASHSYFIEFEDGQTSIVDDITYEHLLDVLSNTYHLLQLNNYFLVKPNLINYIYVTDKEVTVYLVNENIIVVPITQESYIRDYMEQYILTTQHFRGYGG